MSEDEPGLAGLEARGAVRRGSWRLLWLLVALGALVVVILVSIAVGSRQIPLGTVLDALVDPSDADDEHVVVRSLRVPRTVAGLLVGVALGLAGAVMQGVTRNPLADPGLLGVSAGASFAVVFAISVLGVGSALGYVWFAFAGPRSPRSSSTRSAPSAAAARRRSSSRSPAPRSARSCCP